MKWHTNYKTATNTSNTNGLRKSLPTQAFSGLMSQNTIHSKSLIKRQLQQIEYTPTTVNFFTHYIEKIQLDINEAVKVHLMVVSLHLKRLHLSASFCFNIKHDYIEYLFYCFKALRISGTKYIEESKHFASRVKVKENNRGKHLINKEYFEFVK